MSTKDQPFDAPEWWLGPARAAVVKNGQLVQLGVELQGLVGRDKKWSHSLLSRFANGEDVVTQELALAISLKFGIPRPWFVARNIAEAKLMEQAQEITNSTANTEAIRIGRLSQRDQDIADLESETQRHTTLRDSRDAEARGKSRRRPGRVD